MIVIKNDLDYWRNKLKDVVSPELVDDVIVDINDIHNQQLALMAKKNKDYGNTLYEACDAIGDIYAYCRIFDKAKRFISLIKNHGEAEIEDDTLEDTIRDLANYCNMYLAWKNRYKEVQIPSTGEQEKDSPKIELCMLVSTDKVRLVSEIDGTDNTDEIIMDYGLSGLCKDKDNYVYNVTASDNEIPVTNRKQENVVAVRTELVRKYQQRCKVMNKNR